MSPDSRTIQWLPVDPAASTTERRTVPLDVELERLEAELRAAGARARLAGYGVTQPTRFFSQQLRSRLIASLEGRAGD